MAGPGPAHTRHPAALRTQQGVCDNQGSHIPDVTGQNFSESSCHKVGTQSRGRLARTGPQPKAQNPYFPPIQMKVPDTSPSDSAATWPPQVLSFKRTPRPVQSLCPVSLSTTPPSSLLREDCLRQASPAPDCRQPRGLVERRPLRPAIPSEVPTGALLLL